MVLTLWLALGWFWFYRVAGWVEVLGGRWPPLLLLWLIIALSKLIDINIELEKLLSDEILNELVIINQFLVIDFGAALEFHLFRVVLPLDFDLDKGSADQFEHLLRITLEFHTHMERPLLLNLEVKLTLISPWVCAERIFRVRVLLIQWVFW